MDFVVSGSGAALCVEAEGKLLYDVGDAVAVLGFSFLEKMAVAGYADEFWYEEPEGAGYELGAATEVCCTDALARGM